MKVLAISLVVALSTSACSTAGGIYKKDDPAHGEFSMEKTILTVLGVIATAAVVKNNAGSDDDYTKYQPDMFVAPWFTSDNVATTSNTPEVAVQRQQLLTELEQTDKSRAEAIERLQQKLADLDKR